MTNEEKTAVLEELYAYLCGEPGKKAPEYIRMREAMQSAIYAIRTASKGEPLTKELLLEMDGQPVYVQVEIHTHLNGWYIVRVENDVIQMWRDGEWMQFVNSEMKVYAHHPAQIDQSRWIPFATIGGNTGVICEKCGYREYDHVKYTRFQFCPECGRPMNNDTYVFLV